MCSTGIQISPSEYRYLQEFVKFSKRNKVKLDILLKNLDTMVAEKFQTIVNRLKLIANQSIKNKNDLFSSDEILEFTNANNTLKNGIRERKDGNFEFNNMILPINHFENSVFISEHNLSHLKTLNEIGNKAIIDVGGFIGDSILIFRKYLKNQIYSFEPVMENFHLIKKTIQLNDIKDTVIENMALGDKNENIKISICGSGSSFKHNFTGIEEEVTVTTLDDYVERNNIKVGLIKVDIEGFEQNFLKGAIQTIKKQKPILLISIYHNYSDFYDIKPFIENLNLGYKFDIHKPVDGQILSETLLICEVY